jgi:hypothetical protein
MDNYRCYLSVWVQIFKSSGQDFFSNLVIPRVHLSTLMETLMVAPLVLVTLMMLSSSSVTDQHDYTRLSKKIFRQSR